jgi:GNAT superfamily N-acetyltransferase
MQRLETGGDMRLELRRAADLTAEEKSALSALTLAVYPAETAAQWPGQAIEWAAPQWSVIGWDATGMAGCHVGVFVREARWNERAVTVGGIGGVKTHPALRGRGFASAAIRRAVGFFHEQGTIDFALLVCAPGLVPFYERLGWRSFAGALLVAQKNATLPFTFNLPMTTPVRLSESIDGTVDLQGPPW